MKHNSRILEAVHDTAKDLNEHGFIDITVRAATLPEYAVGRPAMQFACGLHMPTSCDYP